MISHDGTAWETDQLMRVSKERFKEYSGSESDAISVDVPETLALLQGTPALLMYESGADGSSAEVVKYGHIQDVRVSGHDVAFRFSQQGTFPRSVIYEFANRIGLVHSERNRTHWALKDGGLPGGLLDQLHTPSEQSGKLAGGATPEASASGTAFISYSWDNAFHKRWVLDFATRLRSDGIDTILDQTHLELGGRTPEFMERSVRQSRAVLVICTIAYKHRFDSRVGGAGFEGHIITFEMLAAAGPKFIPVLREGDWSSAVPTAFNGVHGIDLRADTEESYQALVRRLHGVAPVLPVGRRPDWL